MTAGSGAGTVRADPGGIAYERMGSGEPLLLIHGTGGSRAHWSPVTGLLASRRELLLVDLPGHGESGPPREDGRLAHTPIGYASALGALLDELGIDSAHVAGNSVGGWTALELAKLGRARSVVALSPAGMWERRDPWRCVAQLWSEHKLGRAFAPLTPSVMRSRVGRSLFLRGTVARPGQMPADAAVELATTYAQTRCFDAHLASTRRERFRDGREIEAPVTVAWGGKDRLIPAKARRRDELPENARVIGLRGCGHLPMWDDPELVARTILDGASPAM
jgi:pimeloyl-ACP methyl ester carboxylesterase